MCMALMVLPDTCTECSTMHVIETQTVPTHQDVIPLHNVARAQSPLIYGSANHGASYWICLVCHCLVATGSITKILAWEASLR